MIICVTGLPGSGKSAVGQIIEGKGYELYEMGDIVREEMRKKSINITPDSERKFSNWLRNKKGKEVVMKMMLKKLKLNRRSKVVISGVRDVWEIKHFRKLENTVTIAVVAPARLRFERQEKRGRADAPKTFKQFVERDRTEIGWGELQALKEADYVIANTGTHADLKKAVLAVLADVNSS